MINEKVQGKKDRVELLKARNERLAKEINEKKGNQRLETNDVFVKAPVEMNVLLKTKTTAPRLEPDQYHSQGGFSKTSQNLNKATTQ